VMEDPPWSDIRPDKEQMQAHLQDWKKRNQAAKQKTVKQLVTLKKKESPNWEDAILEEWAQSKLDFDPVVFDLQPIKQIDWREQATAIKVPTLIITGDKELGAILTPEMGVEAVQLFDQAEFGHISGAGHCVRYEQYQPYLAMLKLFLKQHMPV
ncbi:MAG: alpha/beta fold hydrolase, partial [Anaerolineales bacterium]